MPTRPGIHTRRRRRPDGREDGPVLPWLRVDGVFHRHVPGEHEPDGAGKGV